METTKNFKKLGNLGRISQLRLSFTDEITIDNVMYKNNLILILILASKKIKYGGFYTISFHLR